MSLSSLPGLSSWGGSSKSLGDRSAPSPADMETTSDFNIPHKNASDSQLKKWREAAFVLNASRRFRYVGDLNQRKQLAQRKQLKVVGVATQAALRFISAGAQAPENVSAAQREAHEAGFGIDPVTLSSMIEKQDLGTLEHHGGVQGIADALNSDLKKGLDTRRDSSNIKLRQDVFLSNTYPEKKPKGFWQFVLEATRDLTLMILAVCVVVSLAVGIATEGLKSGWHDGAGIGFSIVLVVFVTATSDYQQSLQFRELDKEKKRIYVQVTRDEKREKVSIYDLVVGDIVHLSIGDQVPADGLLFEGHELTVDESSMTGESHPLHKSPEKPFLLSGTKIQDGSGLMLVTGVGMHTEWGHLMGTLGEKSDSETPLQVRLNGLATFIGRLGLGFAILTFLVLLGRFMIDKVAKSESFSWADAVTIVDYFAIAVTIIVVAVPEGLPLAVTLTLAFAMKKMMYDKALVRKLAACETMGSATAICSDKTGTLTTNKMTVVKAWVAGAIRDINGIKSELSQSVKDLMIEHVCLNTSGDVGEIGEDGKPELMGTPTETALLGFGFSLGGNFKETCNKYEIVKVNPFNSARKKMGVVVQHKGEPLRAHWKGASEIVLGLCDKTIDDDGNEIPLDESKYEELTGVIGQFAKEALRTLCLAYRTLEERHCSEVPEQHFVCLAIVGIKDPVRQGVPEAVKLCFSAGIKVRMVTGDNIDTARAIARECGILTDGEAVEGPDFRTWSEEEMKARVPKIQVMARSSPTDKLTLVKMLRGTDEERAKGLGEVVAVTGDGTNDAPALHEADIGMAMGIAGTEVAKESADVIVLDDNFGTIVVVAKWGRAVYTNIQKFVQFQLTVNVVALFLNFTSACITGDAPLTAVQLLWVNLIMDTLGALALATEPPNDDLMKRKSVGLKSEFISKIMWRNIFGQVIYQLLVLEVLQYLGEEILGLQGSQKEKTDLLNTMIFNIFVLCQVFNEINSREMEKLNVLAHAFDNWIFLLIITFTLVFQWIMVTFLGDFANTVALSWQQWLISVGFGALSMVVAVLVKLIPVRPETELGPPHEETNGAQNPRRKSGRYQNSEETQPLMENGEEVRNDGEV